MLLEAATGPQGSVIQLDADGHQATPSQIGATPYLRQRLRAAVYIAELRCS
jgi:hypothetical protein